MCNPGKAYGSDVNNLRRVTKNCLASVTSAVRGLAGLSPSKKLRAACARVCARSFEKQKTDARTLKLILAKFRF